MPKMSTPGTTSSGHRREGKVLLDAFQNRLVYTGALVCKSALRIGAGRSSEPIGTDLPVIKDAQGHPFIPGSSLKGVLRARVEAFVRAIHNTRQAACNPVGNDTEWCISSSEGLSDQAIDEQSCLVCQVFGSPWLASKVQVRDAPVAPLWFDQYQVWDGVAINRDTQTAEAGLKYDYEVVPAQTRFDFMLVAENLTVAQIGMLFVGLRPFERGEIGLGGFRSRGLGTVQLQWRERKFFAVNGDPERLFRFLAGDDSPTVWQTFSEETIDQTYLAAFRQQLRDFSRNGGAAHA
jgi:CRISPR-associated RAMP protein (TIGR02581 family)